MVIVERGESCELLEDVETLLCCVVLEGVRDIFVIQSKRIEANYPDVERDNNYCNFRSISINFWR